MYSIEKNYEANLYPPTLLPPNKQQGNLILRVSAEAKSFANTNMTLIKDTESWSH